MIALVPRFFTTFKAFDPPFVAAVDNLVTLQLIEPRVQQH
jgi:hypothetical protein